MEIVRCGVCNRKLAEAIFTALSIKCPRCGTFNNLKAIEPLIRTPSASDIEVINDKTNHPVARWKTPPS